MSAKTIAEQGLFNNPLEERQLFADRASFDLVIYYDQNSQEKEHSPPLITLFRALHDLEFETVLPRRPVLLVGGFDAWLDCAGMDWVEGQDVDNAKSLHPSPTPSLDYMDQNGSYRSGSTSMATSPNQTYSILTKVARGGGISRTEGKAILANIEDYVRRLIFTSHQLMLFSMYTSTHSNSRVSSLIFHVRFIVRTVLSR